MHNDFIVIGPSADPATIKGLPVLDALMMGRFETAILISFLLSIVATIVGAWVAEKNLVARDLKNK